jgi:uncharacterized iron-regulated membrane protein
MLWTLGGLYFSWTTLHEIHGDHLCHETTMPDAALIRTFAILSIVDVLSGFLLYFTSSKTIRRIFKKRQAKVKI